MPFKVNDYVRVIDPKDFNEGSVGLIRTYIPAEKKYVVGIKDSPHYYENQLQLAGGKRRTNKRKSRKSRKSRRSRR